MPTDQAAANWPSYGSRSGRHDTLRRAGALVRRERLLDVATGVVFSAFLIIQIAHHAMWRDELNAWGVVLDSTSLGDLLLTHLHYEGHPGLWHSLLWLASRISAAPETLQVVHALIALGIVWMVVLVSPFGPGEKILILLSYFIAFEYTVISRNYGIGLLLALVYAHRRARYSRQIEANAVLLGLLANTNLFALILAGAMALEYAVSLHAERRSTGAWIARLAAPATILLAATVFSIATFWPAADISWRTTGRPLANGFSIDELANVVTNNLSALAPITVQAFWSSGQGPAIYAYPALRFLILAASPLLAILIVRIFAPAPRLLLIPAATFLGSVLFNILFYEGSVRHWGINFVAFIAALWILRASMPVRTPLAYPLLGLNAVAGVFFTVQHLTIPFSNAGATARWIEAAGLRDAKLIGTPDSYVAAVTELLGRPMRFLDCDCSDTYLAYNNRRDAFRKEQGPERLVRAVAALGDGPTLYLKTEPAAVAEEQALATRQSSLVERAAFTDSLNENYYVYEVLRRPALRGGLGN